MEALPPGRTRPPPPPFSRAGLPHCALQAPPRHHPAREDSERGGPPAPAEAVARRQAHPWGVEGNAADGRLRLRAQRAAPRPHRERADRSAPTSAQQGQRRHTNGYVPPLGKSYDGSS
eukprot:1181352-Prorocentrum_minimum.AAC.2